MFSHFADDVPQVQRRTSSEGQSSQPNAHYAAASGIQEPGAPLPFLEQIQRSFGRHDVSKVQAHIGGAATRAAGQMGASAYATGNHVAFASSPDLHTAAHEAAHIVQQRGGVQLKGGIGETGDAYEQHADAVADLVVKGESAESLLNAQAGTSASGIGHVEHGPSHGPIQKKDPKAPPPPDQQLDIVKRQIEHAYAFICMKQHDSLLNLEQDANKKAQPPLWQELLLAAVEVALAGAMGSIGAIIVKKMGTSIAKEIAEGIKDAAKDLGKKAGKAAINTVLKPGTTAVEAFFRGQREALINLQYQQQKEFIRREPQLTSVEDAQTLLSAVETTFDQAGAIQRDKSLQEWTVYRAKESRGTAKDQKNQDIGTNLGDLSRPTPLFGSDNGVLWLELKKVNKPGDKPVIDSARLDGLQELQKELAEKKVNELHIPKIVAAEVGRDLSWGEKYIDHKSSQTIRVGQNEQRVVWVEPNSDMDWLGARATGGGPELRGTDADSVERQRQKRKQDASNGARMLIEDDLGDQSLKGKLA